MYMKVCIFDLKIPSCSEYRLEWVEFGFQCSKGQTWCAVRVVWVWEPVFSRVWPDVNVKLLEKHRFMQPFDEPHVHILSLLWLGYLGYCIMGILNDGGSWGEFRQSNISFRRFVQNASYVILLQRALTAKSGATYLMCMFCTRVLHWTFRLDFLFGLSWATLTESDGS